MQHTCPSTGLGVNLSCSTVLTLVRAFSLTAFGWPNFYAVRSAGRAWRRRHSIIPRWGGRDGGLLRHSGRLRGYGKLSCGAGRCVASFLGLLMRVKNGLLERQSPCNWRRCGPGMTQNMHAKYLNRAAT